MSLGTKYWNIIKPHSIVVTVSNRRLTLGSHSMAFFLVLAMRCIVQELDKKVSFEYNGTTPTVVIPGSFTMDDVMKCVECIPDEILPVYRKQRAYVNSVLASHEVDKDSPYNKMLFKRKSRGRYELNNSLNYADAN